MANGKKYWEIETPEIIQSEKNVVKVFVDCGKVQVFPRVAGTAHGIGKGATADLELMDAEQLEELRNLMNATIDVQLAKLAEEEKYYKA